MLDRNCITEEFTRRVFVLIANDENVETHVPFEASQQKRWINVFLRLELKPKLFC